MDLPVVCQVSIPPSGISLGLASVWLSFQLEVAVSVPRNAYKFGCFICGLAGNHPISPVWETGIVSITK